MKRKVLHLGYVDRETDMILSSLCNNPKLSGKKWFVRRRPWAINHLGMRPFTSKDIYAGIAESSDKNSYRLCKHCQARLEHLLAIKCLEEL